MQRIIPYGGLLYEGNEVAQHIKKLRGEDERMQIKVPAKTSFDRQRSIVANTTIYKPGEEKIQGLFIPSINVRNDSDEATGKDSVTMIETAQNILHRALPAEIGLETKPGGYSIIDSYIVGDSHQKTIFWVTDFTGIVEEDIERQKKKNPKLQLPFWINIDDYPLIYDKESAPQLHPIHLFLECVLDDLMEKSNSLNNYFIQKQLKRCINRVEKVLEKMPQCTAVSCLI